MPCGPSDLSDDHDGIGCERLLLAHFTVDGFAQEIGVTVVARVLLDHVHDDPAQ